MTDDECGCIVQTDATGTIVVWQTCQSCIEHPPEPPAGMRLTRIKECGCVDR